MSRHRVEMAGMERHAFAFTDGRDVVNVLGGDPCIFEHGIKGDPCQLQGITLPDTHHVSRQPGFLSVLDLEHRRLVVLMPSIPAAMVIARSRPLSIAGGKLSCAERRYRSNPVDVDGDVAIITMMTFLNSRTASFLTTPVKVNSSVTPPERE
jgi:hypothetical protein